MSLSPGFWDDNKRATEILKNIKLNEFWLNLFSATAASVDDFAILFDFWKEGECEEEEVKLANEKALQSLDEAEFKSTLNQPEDELPAVLQVNSGAEN